MSCCVNNLGTFPHNQDINTGIPISVSGNYVVEMEYLGTVLYKRLSIIAPSVVTIPKPFNENYTYKFKVRGPNGYVSMSGCEEYTLKTFVETSEKACDACEEFIYN